MTTSNLPVHKLILFKKQGCYPCKTAQENLDRVLSKFPEYHKYIAVLQKENHQALVVSYDLNLYPTVLVMDEESNELSRKVGARFLTEDWWESALSAIHNIRSKSKISV